MSKSLEALNKLRFAVSIANLPYKECNDLCDIIKQDLEHYHNALQDKYDYSKCLCYDELLVRYKHLEKENQTLKYQVEQLIKINHELGEEK